MILKYRNYLITIICLITETADYYENNYIRLVEYYQKANLMVVLILYHYDRMGKK